MTREAQIGLLLVAGYLAVGLASAVLWAVLEKWQGVTDKNKAPYGLMIPAWPVAALPATLTLVFAAANNAPRWIADMLPVSPEERAKWGKDKPKQRKSWPDFPDLQRK